MLTKPRDFTTILVYEFCGETKTDLDTVTATDRRDAILKATEGMTDVLFAFALEGEHTVTELEGDQIEDLRKKAAARKAAAEKEA